MDVLLSGATATKATRAGANRCDKRQYGGVTLDFERLARVCERHNVARPRLFGSVLTERFDPALSNIDFLVGFKP